MSNFESHEIERMKELMGFGLNESASDGINKPVIEFTQVGADGKNYAIARVRNKHYIMEAPKKESKLLAEDYDYVGGFENRKAYDSYTVASKQFELKMMGINEAYTNEQPVLFDNVQQSDWQINETKEMRAELNRLNQISNNVNIIIEGDVRKGVSMGPVGDTAPYDEKAKADLNINVPLDKTRYTDWTDDDENVSEKVEKTNDEVGSSHASDAPGKKTTGYTEKAPKGKDLKEGRTIRLTEEQVLAWNRNKDDYMDTSHGTEIGDTAPYSEKPCACSNKKCSDGVVCESEGDGDEVSFEINEVPAGMEGLEGDDTAAFGSDNVSGPMASSEDEYEFEIEPDDEPALSDETEFSDEDDLDDETEFSDEDDLDDSEDEYEFDAPTDDPEEMLESLIREAVLNDFGKHPAYRKEPFSLPDNHEPAKREWARRWDKESNLNDEEYGKKIGHNGDPYTEKVIDMLTKKVMSQLTEKKK